MSCHAKNHHLAEEARKTFVSAFGKGEIKRADKCHDCGLLSARTVTTHSSGPRWNTVGHHEDYARPLDVVWLCHHCHNMRHSAIYREQKGDPVWRFYPCPTCGVSGGSSCVTMAGSEEPGTEYPWRASHVSRKALASTIADLCLTGGPR
jgi:predicted RNA-binding Zn-ribbon protein involved in translation (DUF1610 family)